MLSISNFVLELLNKYLKVMKKGVIVFILAALVLVTTGIWFFSSTEKFKLYEFVGFGVIILVVGFAVFIGFKRLSSAKRGEPAEDELSKKVMQKTAALSYYVSLYLWLAIMYFSDKIKYETHTVIGAGILGMAITFAICWLVFNFRGIRNE
jgi:peptidoglycan/LPS O-acetylase OafA/YrhL